MDKKATKQVEEKLIKEKAQIEKQLKSFADKDQNLKGDWDTRFPKWDSGSGSSALETAADAVEEYSSLLPIEFNLELRLQNINEALKRIKKGTYGICQKCKKQVSSQRLKINPEAKFCMDCQSKLKPV